MNIRQVEHVYGYRGHDCRGNLFQLPSARAVYHCASLALAEDTALRKQVFLVLFSRLYLQVCSPNNTYF